MNSTTFVTIHIAGQTAIVSPEDASLVAPYRWGLNRAKGGKFYLMASRNGETIHMHRLIAKPPEGMVVDHINANPMDNRRENLRVCTPKQNSMSRRRYKGAASQYKGVTPRDGKWRAQISVNRKTLVLGKFTSEIDAARAYDDAARKYFGEFACPNFPKIAVDAIAEFESDENFIPKG